MKYLILVLLLVSGIAHGQMYLSDPYVPDLYEQQRNQQLQQQLQQRPSLNY